MKQFATLFFYIASFELFGSGHGHLATLPEERRQNERVVLPAYDNDDVAECDSQEPGSLHHGLHAVRGLIPRRFVNFFFFFIPFIILYN